MRRIAGITAAAAVIVAASGVPASAAPPAQSASTGVTTVRLNPICIIFPKLCH